MKKKKHLAGLLIGITAWAISILFFNTHPGKTLELKGLDYLFYLRGSLPAPKDIIIVAIDEASFSELKLPWPWPRSLHAKLINTLTSAGAKVIGFDVLFADPTVEEEDTILSQAIESSGNVVLASDISITEEHGYRQIAEIEPIPILKKAAKGIGTSTIIYDMDNVVRRSRLVFGRTKSFACEVLRAYSLAPWGEKGMKGSILINFIGPSRSIKTVSYYQALDYINYLPEDIFRDKIVLVGRSLSASPEPQAKAPDVFPIPRFLEGKTQMSGVEITANFIDTILRERYIKKTPKGYIYLMLVLLLALSLAGYISGLILTILITVIYGAAAYFYFAYKNILPPVFMPIIGFWLLYGLNSLANFFIGEQEKKYIKSAFQKYVPPSVVKKIMESKESLKLGGIEITGTVLFSDLEKFTTISEKFTPEKLVSFINEYLSEMSDIIFKYDGTITRFIGDAILAVWGAPVWHKDHAVKAVLAGIEMRDRLKELNLGLKVRIGINTGPMVVGNVGSKRHIDYTAMGDSVNLASRLEEANKNYGTNIIISHSTYELVKDTIECRQLDTTTVKGREEPVTIYEPIHALTHTPHI